MKQMSRRERVLAAVNRQPVDRVPYAVWRHFPSVDHSPAGWARPGRRQGERRKVELAQVCLPACDGIVANECPLSIGPP